MYITHSLIDPPSYTSVSLSPLLKIQDRENPAQLPQNSKRKKNLAQSRSHSRFLSNPLAISLNPLPDDPPPYASRFSIIPLQNLKTVKNPAQAGDLGFLDTKSCVKALQVSEGFHRHLYEGVTICVD
ncbi:hypothetical protein LXL04_007215 [Taraxacum kok-saghyz]